MMLVLVHDMEYGAEGLSDYFLINAVQLYKTLRTWKRPDRQLSRFARLGAIVIAHSLDMDGTTPTNDIKQHPMAPI